jgi:hypothetical protein
VKHKSALYIQQLAAIATLLQVDLKSRSIGSKRMAVVATMVVVKCNPKLLAATVNLSGPGAAAAVRVACCGIGHFTGTNHGIPAVVANAIEAGPGTIAFFALPKDLTPCTLLETVPSEEDRAGAASLLFFIISFERFLKGAGPGPEHREMRFGCFAKLSGGGFPLEHWTDVGIRTTFGSAVKVCCINMACLSGFDYFTVGVMVKLQNAFDVPWALLLRLFSGDVAMPIGVIPTYTVEEDGLSVSSELFADSVSPGVRADVLVGIDRPPPTQSDVDCERMLARMEWPIGISGRRLSFTPQPQVGLLSTCFILYCTSIHTPRSNFSLFTHFRPPLVRLLLPLWPAWGWEAKSMNSMAVLVDKHAG